MSQLSRRSLVAGAASLSALAAGSAAARAEPEAGSDAELLRLGAALDRIEQEWLVLHTADVKEYAIIDARVEAATGISMDNAPELTTENRDEGYWGTRRRIIEEYPCEDPDLTRWENIHERLYPLVDEILSLTASTPAGLAVQAKAAALTNADNEGDDNSRERLFVEAVCAFCNIAPLPLQLFAYWS